LSAATVVRRDGIADPLHEPFSRIYNAHRLQKFTGSSVIRRKNQPDSIQPTVLRTYCIKTVRSECVTVSSAEVAKDNLGHFESLKLMVAFDWQGKTFTRTVICKVKKKNDSWYKIELVLLRDATKTDIF